jgi:hypothetical protein
VFDGENKNNIFIKPTKFNRFSLSPSNILGLKTTSYSREPQTTKIVKIERRIKKSPTLFTSMAFIAALLA